MKFFSTVALGFLVVSCGGGSSSGIPQADACNQASRAACAKLFSCPDQILMTARGLFFGGTEEMCRTTIQQGYCAPFMCMPGQTYHGDKAQLCKDQFATVSCSTLATAAASLSVATVLASVPGCSEVCTSGDAGASGG